MSTYIQSNRKKDLITYLKRIKRSKLIPKIRKIGSKYGVPA